MYLKCLWAKINSLMITWMILCFSFNNDKFGMLWNAWILHNINNVHYLLKDRQVEQNGCLILVGKLVCITYKAYVVEKSTRYTSICQDHMKHWILVRDFQNTYCGNLRCVGLLVIVLGLLGMLCNVLGMPWQRPRHACNVLGLLGMLPARS